MTEPATASPARSPALLLDTIATRAAVPLWVGAGAAFKLAERNPQLLPKPLFDAARSFDGTFGLTGLAWLDVVLRAAIAGELILVAIMLFMPGLARWAALFTLGVFITILLALIAPLWQEGGMASVLKGSCGCFGNAGPNPLAVLSIDATLFLIVLGTTLATRKARAASGTNRASQGVAPAAIIGLLALLIVALVPEKAGIAVGPEDGGTGAGTSAGTSAGSGTGATAPAPAPAPGPAPAPAPAPAAGWPRPPAQLEAFYMPEFADWVGTRLDSHPEAAIITPAPPAGINAGTWNVVFYREDCDHCHELLSTYFSPEVRHPTLCIAIPDTDPAAALEMPCEECQLRSLIKGPGFVVSTPILLRIEDGVVTRHCADPEDPTEVEACIE